jgi:hypothetical protein
LAEEHSDILVPGGEPLGVAFCSTFTDKPQKRDPGDDLKYLAEQTCGKLHARDSFVVFGGLLMLTIPLRGVSPLFNLKTYFGQE